MNYLAPTGGLVGISASPAATASYRDDADLAARLEAELGAMHPQLDLQVKARRSLRWPTLMPSFPAGRARQLAAFRASTEPGPVQFAGDYLYGPMMEGAVQAGQDAGKRIAEHLL
jgi:oxygen-dependent protoporphyrinogen oxidase